MISILRYHEPNLGARLGCLLDGSVYDVTPQVGSLTTWLQTSVGHVSEALSELERIAAGSISSFAYAELDHPPSAGSPYLLSPVECQEVWGAGVTYLRSRDARQAEAVDGGDVYARVYAAARPELFLKALGEKTVGPRHFVGIRADASWSVPEPELTILFNPALEAVGYTIGNDLSSRDIEGANPLYLPQAKIYTAACALGPLIALQPLEAWPQVEIRLTITRAGSEVFTAATHSRLIQRPLMELAAYLGRSNSFPYGVALLSGTGIVPPNDFSLQSGDWVAIVMDGVGELFNPVEVV